MVIIVLPSGLESNSSHELLFATFGYWWTRRCMIDFSLFLMSSSVLSNNQASMIVRVCNTLSNIRQDPFLTYVTHVCYPYMILCLDIVIAKFILSLFLLQTLAAFLPSFKMLFQGSACLAISTSYPKLQSVLCHINLSGISTL